MFHFGPMGRANGPGPMSQGPWPRPMGQGPGLPKSRQGPGGPGHPLPASEKLRKIDVLEKWIRNLKTNDMFCLIYIFWIQFEKKHATSGKIDKSA